MSGETHVRRTGQDRETLPRHGQVTIEIVDTPAWREGSLELHAEPGAELVGVRKRTPDT